MDPQQTAEIYDRLAHVWHDDAFNHLNGIGQHQRALRFVAGRRHAIDIGCGSSGRIIGLLLAEGFAVEGLDISPGMLRLAEKRHPAVPYHLADIRTWQAPRKYDFISAWDSIWHAPLADHGAILEKLCGALAEGGVLIFTTGGVDGPEEVTNDHMGEPLYHAAPGIPMLLETISRHGCICRHLEYDQWPEKHVYLIVQKI